MGDRRPTRGINQRVREPVRLPDPTTNEDLETFLTRSDREDLRRLAQLLAKGEAED